MKIILKGTDKIFRVDCPFCQSTIEFGGDELIDSPTHLGHEFQICDCCGINCPVCKQRIPVHLAKEYNPPV